MDEVDKIIIHSLKQVGCELDDEIETLQQFTTELVVEATVRCLRVIQPGLTLSVSLPSSMSARFRIAAEIAQVCSDLGYPGDVGYQTFLYSSVADVRKVLIFLIEKLPKESEKVVEVPSGKAALFQQALSDLLKKQLSTPWIPNYCNTKGVRWLKDGTWSREGYAHAYSFRSCPLSVPYVMTKKSEMTDAMMEYFKLYAPIVNDQPKNPNGLIPSLIQLNANSLAMERNLPDKEASILMKPWLPSPKITDEVKDHILEPRPRSSIIGASGKAPIPRPRPPPKPKQLTEGRNKETSADGVIVNDAKKTDKEEEEDGIEKNVENLRHQVNEIQLQAEDLRKEVKTLKVKVSQALEEYREEEKPCQEVEERLALWRRTEEILPRPGSEGLAGEGVERLKNMADASARRLLSLASAWDERRTPLLAEYRRLREHDTNRASEAQKQVELLRSLREKTREVMEEVREKEQIRKQLTAEREKITKDVGRSAYTRRIMEIIGNIRKQNEDIEKVLQDTRDVQKEINQLTGRLDRSFTVADELIFRDAKKDETARKAYKLLATLHSDCSDIVRMVEETGATVREIRDLEDQIQTEEANSVASNLERITADLKQMRQESAALAARLERKS
ncbi:coiled-coil domain-containing protein 22 homolog [Ischnura elegans]|uniref:coiled-coil domain-containing protein 22 homolog n=1 Tax=Ischnura elegans TaxID=197161 RepID=UPI001ED8BD1E|nr:coiled-coil domain-containing protein 22 homolog [Ischnura elegans]